MSERPLLTISDLSVGFPDADGVIQPVVKSLSARVRPGEIVAIIGSSGAGKSVVAEALLGVSSPAAHVAGHIEYRGTRLDAKGIRALAGREIAYIPQSVNSLDPLMTIGKQVRGRGTAMKRRVRETFAHYELPPDTVDRYPFEISGGMARRVLIAAAFLSKAELIIADEPTPGLHAGLAERVMEDLRELADRGNSVMLITHDVDLALRYADWVSVFYAGTTVEVGRVRDWGIGAEDVGAPRHPYSRDLLAALPGRSFQAVPGAQPLPGTYQGCPYAPRCRWQVADCDSEVPVVQVGEGMVRCVNPQAHQGFATTDGGKRP